MFYRFFPMTALVGIVLMSGLATAEPYRPTAGDRIGLIGNAFGERLQHYNRFEAMLHSVAGEQTIATRNLCFPGDEVYHRIRSENFGDPDDHLTHSKVNVVMMFFGYNESFNGVEDSPRFAKRLKQLVTETQAADYGGGKVRVVLVSPIAFEDTGDRNLPDGTLHNKRLAAYTQATQTVADETGAAFADVFNPTLELFRDSDERFTFNGCHLNASGYDAVAPLLLRAVTGEKAPDVSAAMISAVDEKNFHWWHRYRAVNGYSIYGTRGKAGSDGTYNNRDVMERERVILDQMTANRDQRIWDIAAGRSTGGPIDDSGTLPFIEPKTNVGGEDDINAKRGKLGSLEYLTAAEQMQYFEVHPDFEVQLVASEGTFPELANPVALGFDNAGRLFVSTMPSYPHWKPKTEMDDKILLLHDDDDNGSTDRCTVYADGLHQPTGFEFGMGGMYIAEQPDILFVKDTDGDDVADVETRPLFGFDTADSHHGIAAFEWAPGGQLHFQEGTFKYSQVETPYGLTRLGEGGVWSFDPKTKSIDVLVNFAFANPWGHVINQWGQSFIADASPGNSYWATPISGRIDYPLKHPGGSQHRRVAKLSGGDPKYQHPTFYPKRIRPSAGAAFVSGDHFPPEMLGNFLLTNVIGDRSVLMHTVRQDGSGYMGEEVQPLVSCRDGNFRPVDIAMAPDGSLYVVDWHNALIGHLQHNLRDPSRDHSHGRIWRIKHKTRPLAVSPVIAGEAIPKLVALLSHDDDAVRYRVRRELAARESDAVIAAVTQWLASVEDDDRSATHQRTEALWMFQTHHHVDRPLLDRLLKDANPEARAAAVRVATAWRDQVEQPLEIMGDAIADPHPLVRLEAVRSLSFFEGPEVLQMALSVLNFESDQMTRYTLEETIRRLEQVRSSNDQTPAVASR